MEKFISTISKLIFIITVILLPFLAMGVILGLAGATAKYYVLFTIGYLALIPSSFVCIFKYKFYPVMLLAALLLSSGIVLDATFWAKHNADLCGELRAEPSCVEDECGFTCEDFHGGGFVTGASICRDKDPGLCSEKVKDELKREEIAEEAMRIYGDIVDKIVASPTPENEDFEDQLVAIYNCLELQFGPGYRNTEGRAKQVLFDKNLTEEQLNKYYDYLESDGDVISRKILVAGLSGGNKSLSCDDME